MIKNNYHHMNRRPRQKIGRLGLVGAMLILTASSGVVDDGIIMGGAPAPRADELSFYVPYLTRYAKVYERTDNGSVNYCSDRAWGVVPAREKGRIKLHSGRKAKPVVVCRFNDPLRR